MKKVENTEAFSKVERVHDDQVESLEYVLVYKSIIYVTTRLAKSAHQQIIFAKHLKLKGFRIGENQGFLANTGRGATFSPTIILLV